MFQDLLLNRLCMKQLYFLKFYLTEENFDFVFHVITQF